MIKPKTKLLFVFLFSLLIDVFTGMNMMAFMHAYKFTHFSNAENSRTSSPEDISILEKIAVIFIGVSNPRPEITKYPTQKYASIVLDDKYETSCWKIPCKDSKGTVILFHGYSGCKSGLLKQAKAFLNMHYSVLLVDFMGCGESKGYHTTIGFYEAEQVTKAYNFLRNSGEKNCILYGSSMGAVAIMRAISEHKISPEKIIIECPFSSLLNTVKNRFNVMGFPSFPMANLIVFWGGVQNGFNGFSHQPSEYAQNIHLPVLLMHGKEDQKVSINEIEEIYENIPGEKKLIYFKNTAHENYLLKNKKRWIKIVEDFLNER